MGSSSLRLELSSDGVGMTTKGSVGPLTDSDSSLIERSSKLIDDERVGVLS